MLVLAKGSSSITLRDVASDRHRRPSKLAGQPVNSLAREIRRQLVDRDGIFDSPLPDMQISKRATQSVALRKLLVPSPYVPSFCSSQSLSSATSRSRSTSSPCPA